MKIEPLEPRIAPAALTVESMGRFGLSTQGGGDLASNIDGKLDKLTVKFSVKEAAIVVTDSAATNGKIGSVRIGGSLIGGLADGSGEIFARDGIGPVSIKGDINAASRPGKSAPSRSAHSPRRSPPPPTPQSSSPHSAPTKPSAKSHEHHRTPRISHRLRNIFSTGPIGTIKIGRDLAGGSAEGTGAIFADGAIKSLTIGGSVLGTQFFNTGKVSSDVSLGSVTIRGDLRGGNSLGGAVIDTGTIFSDRIASLTIGGSIIAGRVFGGGFLDHSGSVTARFDISVITVKGSLVGNEEQVVKIFAQGQETPTATSDVAIKSLTIGGRVEHAWILGGVDRTGTGFNGNAQIGAVSVGGDWVASNLASGGTPVNGVFGDGNDTVIAGFGGDAIVARIASITIKGQVTGRAGTTETFGFLAEHIGSFKFNGVTVALRPDAKNDTFGGLGNFDAHSLGPSLSPSTLLKLSPFAVHVFEV